MVHVILCAAVFVALAGRKRSKGSVTLAFVIIFCFAALRYMYGNDYASYSAHYEAIQYGDYSRFEKETLFYFLNRISPSYEAMIAISSLYFLGVVYWMVSKNLSVEYCWLGLFIFLVNPYLFLISLSSIRQCLATTTFIIAVHFGIKRKLLPYLLFVWLASLFHKTALILMPVYIILGTKRAKLIYWIPLLIAMITTILVVDIEELAILFARTFKEKNYFFYAIIGLENTLRATLLTGVSMLYVLANLPRLSGKSVAYAKLYLIGTLFGVLAYRISMITRLQMYFDIFSIVAIPAIAANTDAKGAIKVEQHNQLATVWNVINKYVLPTLIIVIYLLRYYSFFNNPMWEDFFVYQTIFEK